MISPDPCTSPGCTTHPLLPLRHEGLCARCSRLTRKGLPPLPPSSSAPSLSDVVYVVRGRTWHAQKDCVKVRSSEHTLATVLDGRPCQKCALPDLPRYAALAGEPTYVWLRTWPVSESTEDWALSPEKREAEAEVVHAVARAASLKTSSPLDETSVSAWGEVSAPFARILCGAFPSFQAPYPVSDEALALFATLYADEPGLDSYPDHTDLERQERISHLWDLAHVTTL